jgi:uncharacterized protein YbjQ (UPF0145 family)
MILATTESIAGRDSVECLGIVVAEAMVAPTTGQLFTLSTEKMHQIRRDLMFDAREQALDQLANIALARGADAVVAIRIDYELIDPAQVFFAATAAGTAVKLAPKPESNGEAR